MSACDTALLLVDSSQGIQSQTLSNYYLAMEANLTIIPIITKIDYPRNLTF
jgi:translation elongation factor EF-4